MIVLFLYKLLQIESKNAPFMVFLNSCYFTLSPDNIEVTTNLFIFFSHSLVFLYDYVPLVFFLRSTYSVRRTPRTHPGIQSIAERHYVRDDHLAFHIKLPAFTFSFWFLVTGRCFADCYHLCSLSQGKKDSQLRLDRHKNFTTLS